MDQNIVLTIRRKSIAKIEKNALTMERCLHLLDSGSQNIYLMEKGRFTGYAINGKICKNSFVVGKGQVTWEPKAVTVSALQEKLFYAMSREEQIAQLRTIVTQHREQDEFPLLDEAGEIIAVIEKKQEVIRIDWEKISFPDELRPYGKYYLSSLGNDNLLGFYLRYRKEFPMEVLSQENLTEAFLGAGMLLFEADCFPEGKKASLLEAVKHQAAYEAEQQRKAAEEQQRKQAEEERARREEEEKKRAKEIKKHLPVVRIAKKWASIREDQLIDSSQLIEFFDEGYYSVSIVDYKGYFKAVVCLNDFLERYPSKNFKFHPELYVEYEEDEKKLKWKLTEKFLGTKRKEIPILKDGKIVALGRYSFYFDSAERWLERQVFRFQWNWIDDDVAKEFFANRRKILISSQQGYLKGFCDRFSKWLDITIYNDSLLGKIYAGDYDLLICGIDTNKDFHVPHFMAHQLFIMLLIETVRRWLATKGILFYLFTVNHTVPEIRKRIDKLEEMIGGEQLFLRDGEQRYFISDKYSFDKVLDKEKRHANLHAGRRYTIESNYSLEKCSRIYFYGGCNAIGDGSYSPYETIESNLQNHLNNNKMKYQVVNVGNGGLVDIEGNTTNWLYKLMDTPMCLGDVVIATIDQKYIWRGGNLVYAPKNLYSLLPPFVTPENIERKCFWDPRLGHLNVVGQAIAADYIFGIIKKDLHNRNYTDKRRSFSSMYKLQCEEDSKLRRWLEKLPSIKSDSKKINGAVVMRGDPFTIGHLYLLQQAFKKCDNLYVFLIERKKTLLPAMKKKKMIEACTRNMSLTVLLPFEGCMRDRYGFLLDFFRIYSVGEEMFDPVDDTYIFARYIAPHFNIRMRFVGEESFDIFKHNYNITKHEILLEEGIDYIEIPRMKLSDGRDIVTEKVREIWEKDGWRACIDYLPEEVVKILEKEDADKKEVMGGETIIE